MARHFLLRISAILAFFFPALPLLATVNGFSVDNVPNVVYECTTQKNQVLRLVVQDDGSGDTLQSFRVFNSGPFDPSYDATEPSDILSGGVKLWLAANASTLPEDMTLIGSMAVSAGSPRDWSIASLTQPLVDGNVLVVTFDAQVSISAMRVLRFGVPLGGVALLSGNLPASSLSNSDYQLLTTEQPAYDFQASLLADSVTLIDLGKSNIPLATWRLENNPNAGHGNDAGCNVLNFTVYFEDSTGPVSPSTILDAIQVLNPSDSSVTYIHKILHGNTAYISSHENLRGPGSLLLDLTVDPNYEYGAYMQPGLPADIKILADIKPSVSINNLRMRILGPGDFDCVSANTGNPVTAFADPSFPLSTSLVPIQAPATLLNTTFSAIPSLTEIPKGAQGVTVFRIVHQNPGTSNTGNVEVKTVHFNLLDAADQPIAPTLLLNRVRVWDGVNTYYDRSAFPTTGNTIPITLAFPVNVSPAHPITTYVCVDVRSDAFPTDVQFTVTDLTDPILWRAVQAGTTIVVTTNGNTPFSTTSIPVVTSLQATHRSLLPPTLFQGQSDFPVMELILSHPSTSTVGDVVLHSIQAQLKDTAGTVVDPATMLTSAPGALGSTLPPQTYANGSSSVTVTFTQGITLSPSTSVTLTLSADLAASTSASALMFSIPGATAFNATQPSNPSRVVSIQPGTGGSYPLATSSSPILGASLDRSFTNYPNPFRAGSDKTTLSYFLTASSKVSLTIYTLTGVPVRKVLEDVTQTPGSQAAVWDGRNDKGNTVLNGVYVAVLKIDSSGTVTKVKRLMGVKK